MMFQSSTLHANWFMHSKLKTPKEHIVSDISQAVWTEPTFPQDPLWVRLAGPLVRPNEGGVDLFKAWSMGWLLRDVPFCPLGN